MSNIIQSNPRGEKSDVSKTANTRMLTRIIVLLSESSNPVKYTKLKDYVGSNKLADALNWLQCNNIIIAQTMRTNKIFCKGYILNPLWVKLNKKVRENDKLRVLV